MSLKGTLLGKNDWSDYLQKSDLGDLVKRADSDIKSIPFSGDIGNLYGNPDVKAAVALLEMAITDAFVKGKPITVYAHSYGSVIAYMALREYETDPTFLKLEEVKGRKLQVKLVTFNSPLGRNPAWTDGQLKVIADKLHLTELPRDLKIVKPGNVVWWVNLWAQHDPISGTIATADENIQFDEEVPADLIEWLKKLQLLAGISFAVGPYFFWHAVSYGPADLSGKTFNLKVPEKYWGKIGPLILVEREPSLGAQFYGAPQNPFSPNFVGQCTWFVYGKLLENRLLPNKTIFLGNADTWLPDAQKAGFFTGPQPAKHAIAYWRSIGGSK